MSKILIGSQYFFSCYEDFSSKDIDELEIIETDNFKYMRQLTGKGRCLFQVKKQALKDMYIEQALNSSLGMVIGKFLIPDFCKEIGFTINDLPKLEPLLAKLDEQHKYEELIFYSYLENKNFILTDKQRYNAYQSYKNSRGDL